jgi:hypothetical protein
VFEGEVKDTRDKFSDGKQALSLSGRRRDKMQAKRLGAFNLQRQPCVTVNGELTLIWADGRKA